MGHLTIGTLAKTCGVGVETVRYYQRRGLLDEPKRPAGGVRRYGAETVARLGFLRPMRSCLAACLVAGAACAAAQTAAPLRIAGTTTLTPADLAYTHAAPATHRLQLELFTFRDTRWRPEPILQAVRQAAPIFAQCGIWLERAEFTSLEGGEPQLRILFAPASRALVRQLRPAKPAVFFVQDTRQRPAFDAEAFGQGNTATRPELAGTVWITASSRDLPVVLAHELVHVLADSGEHSDAPGNLMREDTSPENTRLTAEQCERLVASGARTGFLRPVHP